MRIALTSTTKLVELQTKGGGTMPARVWEGTTDSGIPIHCFITRIAPSIENPDASVTQQFEDELSRQAPPTAAVFAYPFRMIL